MQNDLTNKTKELRDALITQRAIIEDTLALCQQYLDMVGGWERRWHNQEMIKLYGPSWEKEQEESDE